VSVQTDILALRNGFHVEITQQGGGQLPSFSIPLDVAVTMPTLEEIRHFLGKDVAATDLLELSAGLWPVNGQAGRRGYVLHGPQNALVRGSCLARPGSIHQLAPCFHYLNLLFS